MAAPTNVTAATATVLASLPASVTQTVHDAGTTYTVWYAYTATAEDVWLGVWAFGNLGTYQPTITTWLGPPGAPVAYLAITADNVPIQLPVEAGTTYYFQIAPPGGAPTPAVLTLSVVRGPQYDVPIGSIAVNDDTPGFPLVFLDSTTGAVLRAVHPFPAGEAGDTLPSGVVAVSALSANQIAVYTAALTAVAPPLSVPGNLAGSIRAHAADRFYVANDSANQIRTITPSGVFGPTTWTTSGGASSLRALAVNQAETLAYYADMQAGVNLIKTWQLTTDTAGGTFHTFPAGFAPADILVLADDTVLIGYGGGLITTDTAKVFHLSPAGTELHVYTWTGLDPTAEAIMRLAMAIDEPEMFWIWTHYTGGVSRFRKVRLSDGAELVSVEVTEFEGGASQAAASADPARFGISFSCPFWIVRAALAGPDGPAPEPEPDLDAPPYVAPSYYLDAHYIRRLRRAPHVAQEHTRLVYRKFELDLERGIGLATGQGADPIVLLRVSRDGGHTWSEPVAMHAGQMGAYSQRVIARRLGHARDAVFEVTVSDPVAWSLVQAWLDVEPGAH